MSHLNLPSRIHEPQKVKWTQDEYTFTCIIDDRFTPISAPIETRELNPAIGMLLKGKHGTTIKHGGMTIYALI
jgi:hypothetical protein